MTVCSIFSCYKLYQKVDTPGRLTWNIIMEVWKMIFLSKWVICRFHVNLPGCIAFLDSSFSKKLSFVISLPPKRLCCRRSASPGLRAHLFRIQASTRWEIGFGLQARCGDSHFWTTSGGGHVRLPRSHLTNRWGPGFWGILGMSVKKTTKSLVGS